VQLWSYFHFFSNFVILHSFIRKSSWFCFVPPLRIRSCFKPLARGKIAPTCKY
jgi:hypothetical protein